jgi:hypothetical protein
MVLPGLIAGILTGLLMTTPFSRQASAPSVSQPSPAPLDVASLSPAQLETLAFDVLATLRDKRGLATGTESGVVKSSWFEPPTDPRQIHLGMRNTRRLLPLIKELTLDALRTRLKTKGLLKEKRLIASVRQVVLDRRLGDSAEVWDEDLSVIHVGPEYAVDLTSDDIAVFMLGHELTHVAARTGRLKQFIEEVSETARLSASVELGEGQKEDLACDFIATEVLKRFIALHPTGEANAARFSHAFGYDPPAERLARAWQDFCASYDGDLRDGEHLNQAQTIRALVGLDPELKALVPDELMSTRLCR